MNDSMKAVRIVVGVDGSPSSVNALREGARLAAELNGTVDAIAVWSAPTKQASYEAVGIGSFSEGATQVMDTALLEAFDGGSPAVVRARVEQGSAAAVLVEASKDARYVVVGRRGHGGLMGVLLGSVSSHTINHAHCPVIVVR